MLGTRGRPKVGAKEKQGEGRTGSIHVREQTRCHVKWRRLIEHDGRHRLKVLIPEHLQARGSTYSRMAECNLCMAMG
jgi:hypothetical protein